MNIITGCSVKKVEKEIADDLKSQFNNFDSKLIIYFASSVFDQDKLALELESKFPKTKIMGCSTAGEIVTGKMLKESVVAMAMNDSVISDVKIEVMQNITEQIDVPSVLKSFSNYYGENIADMDFKKYVGIILIDGMSGCEEKIMEKVGDLTNVTFIGGSAGDDLKFKKTFVYADGKAYANAAVLALIKPKARFGVLKTQSFKVLNNKLTVTKANEAKREVIEFNNKPASIAYSEAVGDSVDKADKYFMKNPVGLMVGKEPYVRSPQQIKGNSMVFYCNVLEGMDLSLLESTDMIIETKDALEKKIKEMGTVEGIINFHCILRTLELENKGQTEAYGKIFEQVPTIGFSTYGEEYIGHINQTSTMLLFKSK